MKTFAQKFDALLRNPDSTARAACAIDKAYNVGNNNPGGHTPFGIENVAAVQNSVAGLYGLLGSATTIAGYRGHLTSNGQATSDGLEEVVRDMAAGRLTNPAELLAARAFSNATWRQRNIDRDIARLEKPINAAIFAEGVLVDNIEQEVAKDDFMWQAASKFVLAEIDGQQ